MDAKNQTFSIVGRDLAQASRDIFRGASSPVPTAMVAGSARLLR
jgi:hypothetical protein